MESPSRTDRLLIVGAGKLGRTIIHSFPDQIAGVLTRRPVEVSRLFSSEQIDISVASALEEINPATYNVIWLAVPDSVIDEVVERIVPQREEWENMLVIHSSGATSLSVLDQLKKRGAITAVLHPNLILQGHDPFPSHTIWGLTSEDDVRSRLEVLLASYISFIIDVPDQNRALYHAAASLAANYPMMLFHIATEFYQAAGLSPETISRLVMEYMQESLRSVSERGLHDALTGPVARGDEETIRKHLQTVEEHFPQYLSLFSELVETTGKAIG